MTGARLPQFKFHLCLLLAVLPWAMHFSSLCLIYEMQIITGPISHGYCED